MRTPKMRKKLRQMIEPPLVGALMVDVFDSLGDVIEERAFNPDQYNAAWDFFAEQKNAAVFQYKGWQMIAESARQTE